MSSVKKGRAKQEQLQAVDYVKMLRWTRANHWLIDLTPIYDYRQVTRLSGNREGFQI